MKLLSTGLLMIALIMAPLLAGAAPGALEINQDCVAVGCFTGDSAGYPVTITKSGAYELTSDLSGPGGGANAIEITAPGPVDIDLGGHTIDGGGSCSGTPVTSCSGVVGGVALLAQSNPPMPLRIHNGTARGFVTAIAIFFAEDGTVLDHLTLTQNSNNGVFVISDQSGSVRIRDSQITRNGNQGVYGSTLVFVENSSVVGNHAEGLIFNVSQSVLVGSRVASNGGKGLDCSSPGEACALGQNTFAGNNGGGTQFTVIALSDMGGNVCLDHASGACP